jgi:hypothetical protein
LSRIWIERQKGAAVFQARTKSLNRNEKNSNFSLEMTPDFPYLWDMKTVIQTPTFISSARAAGISEEYQAEIVNAIATEPTMGDMMPGTSGCRKCRRAGREKGKRGGYRTVHYNGADDVPVLLLATIDKGERDNLSQGERNDLRKAMQTYEAEYRASVAAKVTKLRG